MYNCVWNASLSLRGYETVGEGGEKFASDLKTLVTGESETTTLGIFELLCVEEDDIAEMVRDHKGDSDVTSTFTKELAAMRHEFNTNGTDVDRECFECAQALTTPPTRP